MSKPMTDREVAAEVRRLSKATRVTSGTFRDGFALGAKIALDWSRGRHVRPSDTVAAMDAMYEMGVRSPRPAARRRTP